MTSRQASDIQEIKLANDYNGKRTPNSGGTKFSGGDVVLGDISLLIEAKTSMTPKESFSIKQDWLDKMKEQSFEQGLTRSTLAFRFAPKGTDYFILTRSEFEEYIDFLRKEAN